jgi:tRNA nucleotidyltransferase/poly(A) polymerase
VVRDLLLGRPPADLDIVTAAPLEAVVALFARTVSVGAEFGVVAVVLDGRLYQVARFRREGPYLDGRRPSFVAPADPASDARRRDFTVNALYVDPATGRVLDFVGGRADLEERVVRAVGDAAERFGEDRLRMLRAVRLAAELGFALEAVTRAAIVASAPLVTSVSAERIRDEVLRLLAVPRRGEGVRLLAATGLLAAILPELSDAGVGGRAFDATVVALETLHRPTPALAVAALLHSLGAASRVEAVCRRLRLPAADRRVIVALVSALPTVPQFPRLRAGEVRAILRRAGAAEVLELARVVTAARGVSAAPVRRAAAFVASLPPEGLAPLLSGRDLRSLGLTPGPQFAQMLEAVEEARARGEIASAAEAQAWVRARLGAGPGGATVERSTGPETGPVLGG